jgi:plasmid stabilization system protein ParE
MIGPAWTATLEGDVEEDLAAIELHLFEAYRSFGESTDEARTHAIERVTEIAQAVSRLAFAPHRGQPHDKLMQGLRHLTLNNAVYWFVTDEAARTVRVLAIFFGAQDHRRRMLIRLLGRYRD